MSEYSQPTAARLSKRLANRIDKPDADSIHKRDIHGNSAVLDFLGESLARALDELGKNRERITELERKIDILLGADA